MAEKSQNSSKTNAKSSQIQSKFLASVPKVFKNKSFHGAQNCICAAKKKSSGGIKLFIVKALIGCGSIYLTSWLGVWGDADESAQLFTKIKTAIAEVESKYILSNTGKDEMMGKFENSKKLVKTQWDNFSKEVVERYQKSEKYINDLFKGEKKD